MRRDLRRRDKVGLRMRSTFCSSVQDHRRRKNEWSSTETDEQLNAAFGEKKDAIVAEFKRAFPRKKVEDVLYYAGGSRPGVKNLLARKLEKSKAPVDNYLFAWEYPINGGITSFHCSELAFCFHALKVADSDCHRRRCGRDGLGDDKLVSMLPPAAGRGAVPTSGSAGRGAGRG